MKYKVGDKVRVRKDLEKLVDYDISDWSVLRGKIVTIVDIDNSNKTYQIDEDFGDYDWTDNMFEGKVDDKMEDIEKLRKELHSEIDKRINEEIEKNESVTNCHQLKRWRAKKHNKYYCVDFDFGTITESAETNDGLDNFRYLTHNYFKTEEEAQRHLDNIKTYYELKDLAEELNNGEKIDWDNCGQPKYLIFYNNGNKKIDTDNVWSSQDIGQIYCLDEHFLEKAIEKIGEEKLINFFKEEN